MSSYDLIANQPVVIDNVRQIVAVYFALECVKTLATVYYYCVDKFGLARLSYNT